MRVLLLQKTNIEMNLSDIKIPDEKTMLSVLSSLNQNQATSRRHNLNPDEPEYQDDYDDEKYWKNPPKQLTGKDKIKKILTDEIKKRHSVESILKYLNQVAPFYFDIDVKEHNFKTFLNHDLKTIFDTTNDANWYNGFIYNIVFTVLTNKHKYLLDHYEQDENSNTKPIYNSAQQFIKSTLHLKDNNEIHVLFMQIVDKFCKYYNNRDVELLENNKATQQIINSMHEDDVYFKQQVLDTDFDELCDLFLHHSTQDLAQYQFHGSCVACATELLELVKLIVIDNNTDLNNIAGLTADADWHKMLNAWLYGTPEEQQDETIFDDDDDFDNMANEFEQDGPLKSGKQLQQECYKQYVADARRQSGKASKNTKTITIQNKLTNEKHTFASYGECMKFLNIRSKATFSSFIKGNTKTNKIWQIIINQ